MLPDPFAASMTHHVHFLAEFALQDFQEAGRALDRVTALDALDKICAAHVHQPDHLGRLSDDQACRNLAFANVLADCLPGSALGQLLIAAFMPACRGSEYAPRSRDWIEQIVSPFLVRHGISIFDTPRLQTVNGR